MPGIVSSVAYVRLGAPDLDVQEKFLLDFGLVKVQRDEQRLGPFRPVLAQHGRERVEPLAGLLRVEVGVSHPLPRP